MSTVATRGLTEEQVQSYRRDGYVAVRHVIDAARLAELRAVTDEFLERSRPVAKSDAVFDLDPRHTSARPVLRRIKNPADNHPLYRWVAFESPIPDIVAELLGPNVKFHHSKLNLKGSRVGAPVEWHQDAAFYPHSNDDVLAVGLLLDDSTPDNGALSVLPGSHRGPIYTHFDAAGRFVGCMQAGDIGPLDRGDHVLLALPAGSIHIHHYRLIHWSAPNTSASERRLLINAYSAADAVDQGPDLTGSPLVGTIVRGQAARTIRRDAGEMPAPPDFRKGYTSIYELQSTMGGRDSGSGGGGATDR
jgi:ectoine hydroxylase-related dioxygenase (phytanoyl-CoA dioxygenase family)